MAFDGIFSLNGPVGSGRLSHRTLPHVQNKIWQKTWRIVKIRQIRQSFFPSKVFYYTVMWTCAVTNAHFYKRSH